MWKILILATILIAPAYAITVSLTEGDVVDLGNFTISPYGMVKGIISFKLGSSVWYPQEVWLVPTGTVPDNFRSTSRTLSLSGDQKCTTNLYTINDTQFAFKITQSQIINGSFCALAYTGVYELLVK